MLKQLQLGNKIFPTNIIQGPLAGVSCAPFRRLIWEYSNPAFACTEMISCKTILHQPNVAKRYLAKDSLEGSTCFQLSASNPIELAEATQRVTESGADLIDLNCGCPVNKIRGKGAGSSLLSKPAKLHQMIRAMKDNTHLPVSIKIRVDGGSHEKFNHIVAQVIKDAGADYLIVHGRHWTEHYETPCNYDQIQFFVEELKIPVIGNGDISCINSLKQMLATGCAGVMIGRAGVGQPWLINKLIAEMQNQPFTVPSNKQIAHIFIKHVQELINLLGDEKFAILQARKLAKYYARQLHSRTEFVSAINTCKKIDDFANTCNAYFI